MPHTLDPRLRALALAALAAHVPLVAQAREPAPSGTSRSRHWKCVAVVDGDTLDVSHGDETVRIRLKGIDCPEMDQPFGLAAARFCTRRALGKRLDVEIVGEHYDRKIARVAIKGQSLGEALVRAGLAWHCRRYSRNPVLATLQREARAAGRGLWKSGRPVSPWTHRHRQRSTEAAR